jgi:hypothetical protein
MGSDKSGAIHWRSRVAIADLRHDYVSDLLIQREVRPGELDRPGSDSSLLYDVGPGVSSPVRCPWPCVPSPLPSISRLRSPFAGREEVSPVTAPPRAASRLGAPNQVNGAGRSRDSRSSTLTLRFGSRRRVAPLVRHFREEKRSLPQRCRSMARTSQADSVFESTDQGARDRPLQPRAEGTFCRRSSFGA